MIDARKVTKYAPNTESCDGDHFLKLLASKESNRHSVSLALSACSVDNYDFLLDSIVVAGDGAVLGNRVTLCPTFCRGNQFS